MRGRLSASIRRGIALAAILGFAGCASLPSVGPFVDASNQLRSAVAASGNTVEAELRLMPGGDSSADQLKKQWEARNRAFAAIATYSASLQAIVQAGDQGAASAQKVADSVSNLAKAAGVALPGSPEAVATVTDVAKFLYAQIARARAAKSLLQALETAQPAVESITGLIAADLKDLDEIFVAAATVADNQVRGKFSDLNRQREELLKRIGKFDLSKPELLEEQTKVSQLLQATETWHKDFVGQRKQIADRLRAGRALIHAATQSASDWGIVHGNLVNALRERRPVNLQSLLQSADEIQQLVRKVREL